MAMATSIVDDAEDVQPSPAGTLAAHLPAGWHTVVVMHAGNGRCIDQP